MGNRLREILKREKVSAYRLWKELHIDQGQLSRFFQGKQNISLDRLEQIAKHLGYDIRFVKLRPSQKGGKKWDVSIGEEETTGSSTTATVSKSSKRPIRIKKKSLAGF